VTSPPIWSVTIWVASRAPATPKRPGQRDNEDLLSFVNRQNTEWVKATRRLSPMVLRTLLELGGRETQRHFEAFDPNEMGGPVSWATGDEPAPSWLDLARELTEH